ncbi:MAG: hypothetical protein V3U65_14670 [Granulosicoccaceae bacterium]
MIKYIACVTLIGLLATSSFALSNDLITRNDSDADGVVDTADIDDDNDGVPDIWEIAENGGDIDTDKDGMPDRLDIDSDNDSLLDWQESGAARVGNFSTLAVEAGRLQGDVGLNGMLNIFELNEDSGWLVYGLLDSDADGVPDLKDLDSDNDGLPDMREAGVLAVMDNDGDARIDAPPGSVGRDGIPDQIQKINDQSCCDLNGDGAEDITPRNSDLNDFPDFQDSDSDNDGVSDLVEAGGSDVDANDIIDNFVDNNGDGLDDSLRVMPLALIDSDSNGALAEVDAAERPKSIEDSGSDIQNDPTDVGVVEPGRDPVARPGNNDVPLNDVPLEDGLTSSVQTGLNASGCSIASGSYDFLLMLLAIGSVAVLGWRITLRRMH